MKARYILVLGLAIFAAGCGGSTAAPATQAASTPSAPAPTASSSATSSPLAPASTPPAEYYLAASTTVDSAFVQWTTSIVGLTQPSQFVGPASTYAGALTTFDNTIGDIGATGAAASDIATLVSDDQVVISDLYKVGNQSASGLTLWEAQLIADGETAITEGAVVRADLGLPAS